MSESIFASKTKADLIQIVRLTGVLPIGKAQRMRKQELIDYLEEKMQSEDSALDEDVIQATAKKDDEKKQKKNNNKQKSKADQTSKADAKEDKQEKDSQDENNDQDESIEADNDSEFIARPRPRQKNNKSNKKSKQNKNDDIVVDEASGILEIMQDGYGFLRYENYIQGPKDVYVQAQLIKRFNLRTGDYVAGTVKDNKKDKDRYRALTYIKEVNGRSPEEMKDRPSFERLTPIYPREKFVLETDKDEYATRIIDLFCPIGKGQRGMIVSPPKAGKTILLQQIANAISKNNPETHLMVLLIDERPEEVTDMQRNVDGEVIYSTFDKSPENHVKITELVIERAKRLAELGQDVVILVDSITRMARAYNLTINPTGRTLSGGLDPGAMHHPKRFFGAARNIENGGSLSIIATALIDTGSRMDEVIFEEFKGTGNMEVLLDRDLSEKRIYPAINIIQSSTRREELLLSESELEAVWGVRKVFGNLDTQSVAELILSLMDKTKSNEQLVESLNLTLKNPEILEDMNILNKDKKHSR